MSTPWASSLWNTGHSRAFLQREEINKETTMESGEIAKKEMKVEIPSDAELVSAMSGLARQPSGAKSNCLCSPTTHAGSFRCRLHRTPGLQRTRSMDSNNSLRDSTSKANTTTADSASSSPTKPTAPFSSPDTRQSKSPPPCRSQSSDARTF